jgi:hypothetical protein
LKPQRGGILVAENSYVLGKPQRGDIIESRLFEMHPERMNQSTQYELAIGKGWQRKARSEMDRVAGGLVANSPAPIFIGVPPKNGTTINNC